MYVYLYLCLTFIYTQLICEHFLFYFFHEYEFNILFRKTRPSRPPQRKILFTSIGRRVKHYATGRDQQVLIIFMHAYIMQNYIVREYALVVSVDLQRIRPVTTRTCIPRARVRIVCVHSPTARYITYDRVRSDSAACVRVASERVRVHIHALDLWACNSRQPRQRVRFFFFLLGFFPRARRPTVTRTFCARRRSLCRPLSFSFSAVSHDIVYTHAGRRWCKCIIITHVQRRNGCTYTSCRDPESKYYSLRYVVVTHFKLSI